MCFVSTTHYMMNLYYRELLFKNPKEEHGHLKKYYFCIEHNINPDVTLPAQPGIGVLSLSHSDSIPPIPKN